MKDLTAAAGSGKFNLLFDATAGDETLPSMRKDLAHTVDVVALHLVDSTGQPSHEFLQLYLAATHWLLLFDKVVIYVLLSYHPVTRNGLLIMESSTP